MKPWYLSKTIIFNVLVAALLAVETVTGLLQPHLPANIYLIIAVGLPIINAALRVITSEGVSLK